MDFKIIFLISIITSKGKTEHAVLLEGYPREIKCQKNKFIRVEHIHFPYSPQCFDELNDCSEERRMVVRRCNGKNTCNLQLTEAIRSTCQNTWIRFQYGCYSPWWSTQFVCSNDDACSYSHYIINMENSNNWLIECEKKQVFSVQNSVDCIINHLFNICLKKRGCWWFWRGSTSCCVSFPSVMTVYFSCTNVESNDTFYSIPGNNSKSSTNDSASSEQHFAKINTTYNAGQYKFRVEDRNSVDCYSESSEHKRMTDVILRIDNESRILFYNGRENKTYSVCAHQWDDIKASELCRYLNLSETGIASTVSQNKAYTRMFYAAMCIANERDPLECKFDSSDDICEDVGDAAVRCLPTVPDTDDKGETAVRGKTGLIIAVSVSLIISTVTVLVIVLCTRRSNRREQYKHSENSVQFDNVESSSSGLHIGASLKADNTKHEMSSSREKLSTYVGGEIIEKLSILPTSDSAYLVLDPKETGFNRTRNTDSDKMNEEKDGDHYATTVEGVYDEINNRRHTENDDVNVYSHSVDDVYDVSAHDRPSQNDPTYNQFSGMDLENDYM